MKRLFLLAITAITIGIFAGCGTEGNQASAGDSLLQSGESSDSPQIARQEQADSKTLQTSSGEQKAEAQKSSQGSDIGEDRAVEIALADAGIAEADASYLRVHLDRDDGFIYYDVDFASQGMEYDYAIQVSDGAILKAEREWDDDYRPDGNANQGTQSGSAISYDEAKQLVLNRVPGASDRNLEMELEHDDGILKYEGEVHYNGMEYEFEIHGESGEFIKWHEDWHD